MLRRWLEAMWKSIGVYQYDEKHEALLLDGIRPVIHSLQAEGRLHRAYVLRSFIYGPHLAIYAELDRESEYPALQKTIQDRLSPYLEEHPSLSKPTLQEYTERCSQWLEPEAMALLSHELMDDQKVILQASAACALTRFNRVLQELLHSFHAFNYEMIMKELEATRCDRRQRYMRMLRLMASNHAFDAKQNVWQGANMPRLRMERYLMSLKEGDQVRSHYREADGRWCKAVDDTLVELLQHTREDGVYVGPDRMLRRWSASRRELYKAVHTLTEEGLIISEQGEPSRSSDDRSLAYLMLHETSNALLPLFQIDRYQRYMLEYMLLQSIDRKNAKTPSVHMSHRQQNFAAYSSF